MASQRSEDNGDNFVSDPVLSNYPDYQKDEEIFSKFLQQHTSLAVVSLAGTDDSDEDESMMLNPTASATTGTRRELCYRQHLQRIKDRRYYESEHLAPSEAAAASSPFASNTFVVEVPLDELKNFSIEGGDLAQRAANNTMRYQELFCNVIDQTLAQMQPSAGRNNVHRVGVIRDPIDILQEQRLQQDQIRRQQQDQQDANNGINNIYAGNANFEQDDQQQNQQQRTNAQEMIPPVLLRRYELRILPFGRPGTMPPFDRHVVKRASADKSSSTLVGASLRNVRSKAMGHLVTITGMIVRASDVKPSLIVAAYSCDACGVEVYQVVQNKREFMPQRACPNADCKQPDTLHLQTRASKFCKFQELKLQELPNQVPMGHVPRSLSVYCRGELTRLALPGDVVTIDGVFLPQRLAESGYRAMQAGLITTTYLEAQHVHVHKKSYDESLLADGSLSEEEVARLTAQIMEIATSSDDPIGRLARSIAPEIFGHEDIKRALLLQLVGGCTRTLPDGMRIRGDINICLMGDPGVAKSQLLKQIASIAPRGVYTTGKGSSGVGLTAAVTKDMATGEMALEGGALVLADRGICAIDEFDKMDEGDRTAIHEVMEQQTVSIAKAGIVATLNARAAVLAAANPLYGRYNRSRSLSENVNLPNSLLSRFDLMFLILDLADVDKDTALARHVTFVHQNEGLERSRGDDDDSDTDEAPNRNGGADKNVIPPRVLREYISRARRHQPVVPPDVAPYIVEAYVSLRMQDRPGGRARKQGDQTSMTARQLLSILRLSQALARLRFSDFVAREDVDEAIRLTHMSKASLEDNDDDNGRRRRGEDVMSRVFHIIRDFATVSGSNELEISLCEAMVLRKGFTSQQLQACLEEYEGLNVIRINSERTRLTF
ncbi:hypothetical protein MPSEU_000725600 [Mayamaea pseudoterrestris]|nr:hypothetical protein MPSEU_000725600 [Mayamaea pseudoterrestris]